MAKEILNKDEKEAELKKYRELVLATIDYYLDNDLMKIETEGFDSDQHYASLKIKTEDYYKKGSLSRLKQWFKDLTEMQIETNDLKFNKYLRDRTEYDVDIFKSKFKRVEGIIKKGKITTDSQFYEINGMVNQLCQTEPIDENKVAMLNRLLSDYEQRKSRPLKNKRLA